MVNKYEELFPTIDQKIVVCAEDSSTLILILRTYIGEEDIAKDKISSEIYLSRFDAKELAISLENIIGYLERENKLKEEKD